MPGLVVSVADIWQGLRHDDFVGDPSENVIDIAMFGGATGAMYRLDAIEPKDAPGVT